MRKENPRHSHTDSNAIVLDGADIRNLYITRKGYWILGITGGEDIGFYVSKGKFVGEATDSPQNLYHRIKAYFNL